MARCLICGTLLDRIEVGDGQYIDDDCPYCTPRGYHYTDPDDDEAERD